MVYFAQQDIDRSYDIAITAISREKWSMIANGYCHMHIHNFGVGAFALVLNAQKYSIILIFFDRSQINRWTSTKNGKKRMKISKTNSRAKCPPNKNWRQTNKNHSQLINTTCGKIMTNSICKQFKQKKIKTWNLATIVNCHKILWNLWITQELRFE